MLVMVLGRMLSNRHQECLTASEILKTYDLLQTGFSQ
jgi:hypothetical protein